MKKKLLFIFFSIAFNCTLFSQILYSSTSESSRYNFGNGQAGTPKVAFDDVSIPNALVAGSNSIIVTKVKFAIRRLPNAPATDVKIYYTPFDDTSTVLNSFIQIPPVLLETVSLPANGSSLETAIVSVGDSISTLFEMKTDTSRVYPGYHTFFIGASLSNNNPANAIRLTSQSGANANHIWIYNADSVVSRYEAKFDNFYAAFYIEVFGRTESSSLPITLSSFIGQQKSDGTNLLSWQTETELNNKGFELQHSADGVNFSSVAFVVSKAFRGNSSEKLSYDYTDLKPFAENTYYRLRQLDKDGHFTLSNIVLIKGNQSPTIRLANVYPNPSTAVLKVVLETPVSETINMIISDFAGRALIQKSSQLIAGANTISVNVSKLPSGNYTIKAIGKNDNNVASGHFIKQ